jgi:predicted ATPase
MRLDELSIGQYKNLKDLHVDFDETSPYTVLVGENGAGKSNLIEALTLIFRNIDLELEAPFDYTLKYRCRGNHVEVRAHQGESPQFWAKPPGEQDFVELSKRRFMEVDAQERPIFRPAFVFGYYSGPSDRLEALYERHRERYYSLIIKPRESRDRRGVVNSNALRRLFYAQNLHGQFALLAFFMDTGKSGDADRQFLRQHLQIDGLDSVLFALQRPPWRRPGDDSRFWNAEGEVREFLERLYDAALLPMRMDRRIPVELSKKPVIESLYLFLPDRKSLSKVFKSYPNQYAFFTALESTYISKVLSEVRTRVRITQDAGGGDVTYRDLSEGEQQLLLVLGLLKFTAEDEALFLLDEPDTHLNPVWSTQYLDFLDRFIHERESCHIVMSTHDPLLFARLTKAQVRVFRREPDGVIHAETPLQDPRGMGVQAILTSDLFRLRTTLDPETQHDLDVQRRLSMKTEDLTPLEESELQQVSTKLDESGFSNSNRDPLYSLFLKKWTEREKSEWTKGVQLTPAQLQEQSELAAEIVAEIAAETETATNL